MAFCAEESAILNDGQGRFGYVWFIQMLLVS